MEWLMLAFALEVGLERLPPVTYVEMGVEVTVVNHLVIGGVMTSHQVPHGTYQWRPIGMEYEVTLAFRFPPLEVGFRHYCTHPVVAFNTPTEWKDRGGEQLYLRLSTKH